MDLKQLARLKIQKQLLRPTGGSSQKRRGRTKSASSIERIKSGSNKMSILRRKSHPPLKEDINRPNAVGENASHQQPCTSTESFSTVRDSDTNDPNNLDKSKKLSVHHNVQGISKPFLIQAGDRKPASKRDYLSKSRQYDPNDLGYKPRRNNRHPHQARRQKHYANFEAGIPIYQNVDSDSD